MKVWFLLLGFLACYNTSVAQAQDLGNGLKGIWQQPAQPLDIAPWQAHWIWMNDSISSNALLARKTFDLTELPDTAILRITASSQYQLFLNGKYVRRGPARSAPHHQSFDMFDISKWLTLGKNSIAVRVHRQQNKYSYHFEQRGGLLAQLDLSSKGKLETLSSNSDWKVSSEPSWDNTSSTINRFQQVVNDRVDMRKYIQHWDQIDFDDSQWQKASPLYRNSGWPAVQKNDTPNELTTPWTSLVPRDIPYLNEEQVGAQNLIHAAQVNGDEFIEPIRISRQLPKDFSHAIKRHISKNSPLEIPKAGKGKKWFLLFDFGKVLNGTPNLVIQGPSGTVIEIVGAPYAIDNKFTYKVVDSEFRDKVVLSGKKDHWEATYFKPFRYMGLMVHYFEAPVRLYSVGTRSLTYPFEKQGNMIAKKAPWVENYMNATAKTIAVCTTDAFTDNYRERRQYAQTGYYAALGNYYLFGDTALQRRYLIQTSQEQEPNGIMPAYAPAGSDDYMVILDSNCLWIRSLHDYLLYSGDFTTVRALFASASKLMEALAGFTNEMGMIDSPPYPYWLDHAMLDRRGANLNLNGHYLGALEDFAKILEWLEKPESEYYRKKAALLRTSLQTKLWNKERELFTDALINGEQSEMFSEHSNSTALALNIATQEQATKIAEQLVENDRHNYIKRASGLVMVTPAMSYYLHKGLCEYGFIDQSFEMFRSRFDKMLTPATNGTLWEEWWLNGTGRTGVFDDRKTRSDAQTESAFPPALFANYLLGIKPTKPGMKEIEIRRTKSRIQHLEANVPTPEGNLFVKWDVTKKGVKSLQLQVPGNMKIRLDLKSLLGGGATRISIDGRSLDQELKANQYFTLENGSHTVHF